MVSKACSIRKHAHRTLMQASCGARRSLAAMPALNSIFDKHVLLAFSRTCNTKGGAEVESVSMHTKNGWMQTLPVHPLAGQ